MPHNPTPPDGRKPPRGTSDSVGASRRSAKLTYRRNAKFRVRANAMIAPSRTRAYTKGTYPTGEPKMRYRLPHTTAIGRINTEVRTSNTLPCRVCSSSLGSAPTAAKRASIAFDTIWTRRIIPWKVMSLAASPSPRRTDSVDRWSGPSGKRQPLAVRYIEARSTHDTEATAGHEHPRHKRTTSPITWTAGGCGLTTRIARPLG